MFVLGNIERPSGDAPIRRTAWIDCAAQNPNLQRIVVPHPHGEGRAPNFYSVAGISEPVSLYWCGDNSGTVHVESESYPNNYGIEFAQSLASALGAEFVGIPQHLGYLQLQVSPEPEGIIAITTTAGIQIHGRLEYFSRDKLYYISYDVKSRRFTEGMGFCECRKIRSLALYTDRTDV